jgi:Flp pilus assembly secretin CpaC
MKPHLAAFCAALALTGASFSLAAENPGAAPRFVEEPIASAGTLQGPDAALAASIVKALNGDASLRESKIAVLGEDGKVILSGATETIEQRKAAVRIAEDEAGQGNVVNALQATDSSTENQAPQPKS